MLYVRISVHGFAVLEVFSRSRENEFVGKLAAVPQHELDLLALRDVDPVGCKQHLAVGFRIVTCGILAGFFESPGSPAENASPCARPP
jgi:hypothetical protein